MKILETSFFGKGTQKGFVFEQIKRTEKVAWYKKTLDDLEYHEVFKIPYGSGGIINGIEFKAGEYYPKDNAFGKDLPTAAICTASYKRAAEYYNELTNQTITA